MLTVAAFPAPPPPWPVPPVPIMDPAALLAQVPLSGATADLVRPLVKEASDDIADFLGYCPTWCGVVEDFRGITGTKLYLSQRPISTWPALPVPVNTYQADTPLDPSTYGVDVTRGLLFRPGSWLGLVYDPLIATPEAQPFATVRPPWTVTYWGGWWTDTLGAMTLAANAAAGASSVQIHLPAVGFPPGLAAGSTVAIGATTYAVQTDVPAAVGLTLTVPISPVLAGDVLAGAAVQVTPAGVPLAPPSLYGAVKQLVQLAWASQRANPVIDSMGKAGATLKYRPKATPDAILRAKLGNVRRMTA